MSKRKGRTARLARQERAQIRLIGKIDFSIEGLEKRDPELYSKLKEIARAREEAQRAELELLENLVRDLKMWEPDGISGILVQDEIKQTYTEEEILDGIECHEEK